MKDAISVDDLKDAFILLVKMVDRHEREIRDLRIDNQNLKLALELVKPDDEIAGNYIG